MIKIVEISVRFGMPFRFRAQKKGAPNAPPRRQGRAPRGRCLDQNRRGGNAGRFGHALLLARARGIICRTEFERRSNCGYFGAPRACSLWLLPVKEPTRPLTSSRPVIPNFRLV